MDLPPNCKFADPETRRNLSQYKQLTQDEGFLIFHKDFLPILGPKPQLEAILTFADHPHAHEAGVYIQSQRSLFVTSNQHNHPTHGAQHISIGRICQAADATWTHETISSANIPHPNGGVKDKDGILFCAQGSRSVPGSLTYMASTPPYKTEVLLDHYYGRRFNSPNDVVVMRSDGSVWFTDPVYGAEQGICAAPELPNQVYRFDPASGDVRAVADGFGRPNGICFAPDERTVYVTDTEVLHGDGDVSLTRASSIYAFDVIRVGGSPFLSNRRLFAMAAVGAPDGIKCDTSGNVYSGCGDGVNVWDERGTLLGKILVPGGIANFCFGEGGELFLLNEYKVWHVQLHSAVKGALLEI